MRRIFGDIKMDDSSSVVAEDDQGVEKPKRRGCNNEHVDRRNLGQMVVQEATPGRGGDFGPPRQVSPDRGLADLDAELEQFAMNAGAPQRRLATLIWRISAPVGAAYGVGVDARGRDEL